ncbi:MAG: sulfatase-like hydrolase/transferase [Kiritimatiellaeota bacterium]|nr:sulfatase-like hydrolase/transferase [Kiritimatiellota bacterium]
MAPPHNIVLILADQLSARWLGCYGTFAAHTPNLDALAARGVRFERCFSNHPVCMPARATIFTGRSAPLHGVFYNGYELDPAMPTFPRLLRENRVQTLGVGKFHLECHGRSACNDVEKYGFERAETTEDIRCGHWLDWVRVRHPDSYEQALATVWPEPHLARYGPDGIDLRPALAAAKQRHPSRPVAPMTWPSVVPEEVCQTRWITDRAIRFLEERDSDRPFFLNVSYVDPHDPYDPPARFLELIDPELVPRRVRSDDPALAELSARFSRLPFVHRFADCGEDAWATMRRYYLASLAFIDEQVGRLLDFLEHTGLARNTLVLFTADHGDMLGDHGFPTKGAWHFDACRRVPLIVAGPQVHPRTFPGVVSLLDLFPTIADYACDRPSAFPPIEGRSLRPLLEGGTDPDRPKAVLVESYGSYGNTDLELTARSVVTVQHAYTRFGNGDELLFDLGADPDECVNLACRKEARQWKHALRAAMLDCMTRRYAPLPLRCRHPAARH